MRIIQEVDVNGSGEIDFTGDERHKFLITKPDDRIYYGCDE